MTEWARMIARYRDGDSEKWSDQAILGPLKWVDPEHRTADVHKVLDELRLRGHVVACAWTGKPLLGRIEIDHCFPFALWPNNDLWNLLPTTSAINNQKRDRLVSAEALVRAQETITAWWTTLAAGRERRFAMEAESALPTTRSFPALTVTARVFAGVEHQRLVLHRNQQIKEWHGPRLR